MHRDVEDRLIIESIGFDSLAEGLRMVDFKDEAPEPKYYTVDIPGGDSVIDLTESLNGDVVYNRGKHTFQFVYLGGGDESDEETWDDATYQKHKTRVKNALHGRRFEYRLSFDEPYVHTGRFAVKFDDDEFSETYGTITVSVEREPYKLKGMETVAGNMAAGVLLSITSGRKLVQPTIEFTEAAILVACGKRYEVPAGSYTFHDVWLHSGVNELFAMSQDHRSRITYSELSKYTYEEIRNMRRIFEWMDGLERYTVTSIRIDGPVSGIVTFTVTGEDGSTMDRSVDLGEIVADELRIEGGYALAYVRDEEGEVAYSFELPEMYLTSPIASMACSAGKANYTVEEENVQRVFKYPTYGEYAGKTYAELAAHRYADLRKIDTETYTVCKDGTDTVFVQFPWLDL